jgi:hypothetical protein
MGKIAGVRIGEQYYVHVHGGVVIFNPGYRRFISNSWYVGIDINSL